jgi:hypothetical protein
LQLQLISSSLSSISIRRTQHQMPQLRQCSSVGSNFIQHLIILMKNIILFCFALYCSTNSYSQLPKSSDDKLFKLRLVGNPPMPRENERYTVGLDLTNLRESLFKSFKMSDSIASVTPYYQKEKIDIFSINQLKKGEHTIGPLNFVYGGFNFVTTSLTYKVDDSLPNINEGLWIRHSLKFDSIFCINLEQRIPIEYNGEDDFDAYKKFGHLCRDMVMLDFSQPKFNAFDYFLSENSCSMTHRIINGEKKYFYYHFDNTCVIVKPHDKEIRILKSDFRNMPEIFMLQPIIIK